MRGPIRFVASILLILGAWFFAVVSIAEMLPTTTDGQVMRVIERVGLTFLMIRTLVLLIDMRRHETNVP